MGTGGGCNGGPVDGAGPGLAPWLYPDGGEALTLTGTLLDPDRGGLVLGAAPLDVC